MYLTIFEKIISIMHEDYAGFKDKEGWDNQEYFRRKLNENETITPLQFTELVQDYLLDFNDQHIYFTSSQMGDNSKRECGFKVRRFEDKLYVITVEQDQRFTVGDAIVELDRIPILQLRKQHSRYLDEQHAERENWNPILLKHATCTVQQQDGTRTIIPMEKFSKTPYKATYRIEELKDGIVLITLTDFADPDAIAKLVQDYRDLLHEAETFIIDVRFNLGGNDASFNCLIPYCFPEGETEITDYAELLFNCTERTVDLVVSMIEEELCAISDEKTRDMLRLFKEFYERNRGKGFVSLKLNDDQSESYVMVGSANPKQVIVLSDVFCGSSGDSFVELSKYSSKVTVVGRATAGLNDYSNLAIQKWEEGFELWYPTSKMKRNDEGKGMTGIGIEPDLYIPWTPDHLREDIDLKKALELIKDNKLLMP